MLTYLALFRMPEWTTLSRIQRRAVYKRCIRPLLLRWQVLVARTVFLIIAIVAATTLLHTAPGWHAFITVFVTVLLGSSLFDLVFIASKRQQIGQFIQSHAEEIQSAA